jgi:hypothetical protein
LLGLSETDANAVGKWLAEQQPACSWPSALQLAQAFRNATVHGALSASKVKEWKLRPAFRTLTDDLGSVTAAVLMKLSVQPISEAASASTTPRSQPIAAPKDAATKPVSPQSRRPRKAR